MIVTLTARRLKPGTQDEFHAAFESLAEDAPEEVLRRWPPVYVTSDVTDENVVLTFGLFDGTVEELREAQARGGREERLGRVEQCIDEILLDGSYEVLKEITR